VRIIKPATRGTAARRFFGAGVLCAAVRLVSARLDEVRLDLVEPFETSFGVERRRRFLLLALEAADGRIGYGECVASVDPLYSSESNVSAYDLLSRHFLPSVLRPKDVDPGSFHREVAHFRGNSMAKAAVESALIDLAAQGDRRSVAEYLGGRRRRVEVGVSVGIQPTVRGLVRRIGRYLDAGYGRIKLKVRPGWDAVPVRAVRRAYPDIELWVDANQAYPTAAVERIRRWAEANRVAQVEQAFPERAIRAHAELAKGARFRVCLDESVVDEDSLEDALAAGAVTSLNIKTGRVGGPLTGRALARRAARAHVASWVGGMLESGIGRAHNVALAARPEMTLPADLSASDRYYREDLIERPFVLGPGSTLEVPKGPGIGVELVERTLRRHRIRSKLFRRI
jgi:o-succinylbenzoate synthase